MRWLAENWIFLVVVALFVLMHLSHGGHGGHGAPRRRDENSGEPTEPGARNPRADHRH